ncbi:hypothetical protein [Natrinema versiforme]|uniref:hypothetical protein n=1 Tax=Natrinema versiforme TaxID=88724 RepID=UPI000B0119E8|nr:hypothetical protein [Natrinema versiforme]
MNFNVFSDTTDGWYRSLSTALKVAEDAFLALGLLVVGAITAYVVVATLVVSFGGWFL